MTSLRRKKLIKFYKENKISEFEILVDNLYDPHNVSAISRSCDALGVDTINLYYTYNSSIDFKKIGKGSSSSANAWIKFATIFDSKQKYKDLNSPDFQEVYLKGREKLLNWSKNKKEQGYQILGASVGQKAVRLDNFKFPNKTILIFGNEKKGLSPETKEICDSFLYIPMLGMVDSLNVSVSAGICLYEAFKQKGQNLKTRKEFANLFGERD